MIDRTSKNLCNGCKMCKDICPTNAVYYETNKEGVWFPKVEYDKCIKCGLCVEKCPNITPIAS